MTGIHAAIDRLDWAGSGAQLDAEGHAVLPGLLGADLASELAQRMRAAKDAKGEPGGADLLYFGATLPAPLDAWRTALYGPLAAISNRWNATLGIAARYPAALQGFQRLNQQAGQTRGQSYLSRLVIGNHVPLHPRNHGYQVFPLQVVAVLSKPGVDFQGGEFVMTEQRPRAVAPGGAAAAAGRPGPHRHRATPLQGQQGYLPRQPQARHQPRARGRARRSGTVVPRRAVMTGRTARAHSEQAIRAARA